MKDNVYRNAMNHLHFSEDLEQTVLEKASVKRPSFRIGRQAVIAAVLCILLGTTAFAAEVITQRSFRIREEGKLRSRFFNMKVMEFTNTDHLSGVEVYQMELKPKGYYHFGEGLIYHSAEGFLEVTEGYELKPLEHRTLHATFVKNGRSYELDMAFVEAEGGIYSNLLEYYPVNHGEILINLTAKGNHAWPVYVTIRTGEIRDALPSFTDEDFLPETLESGYEARLAHTQPFRDGILISCLVSGIRNGNTDSGSLHYWVKDNSREVIKLDIPKNCIDYIVDDTLYYQDSAGFCYVMDENFQFHKLDGIPKSTDDLSCGILTARGADGSLKIVDVIHPVVYFCSDVTVGENTLWDTTGYNATRHSTDGRIVVTHSYTDWEAGNRPVDSISYLDVKTGELRQLCIDSNSRVQTHGWLDDDRYCVIYEDGLKRYLTVYEFA